MIAFAWFFAGLVVGCSFGVVLMGMLVAARESVPDRPAKLAGAGGQVMETVDNSPRSAWLN